MIAVKAKYDGRRIVLPRIARAPIGSVIVVFQGAEKDSGEDSWISVQEEAFKKVWENNQDAVYDKRQSK